MSEDKLVWLPNGERGPAWRNDMIARNEKDDEPWVEPTEEEWEAIRARKAVEFEAKLVQAEAAQNWAENVLAEPDRHPAEIVVAAKELRRLSVDKTTMYSLWRMDADRSEKFDLELHRKNTALKSNSVGANEQKKLNIHERFTKRQRLIMELQRNYTSAKPMTLDELLAALADRKCYISRATLGRDLERIRAQSLTTAASERDRPKKLDK